MFVKFSLRDRLVCFADVVRMTRLSVFFLLPLLNYFLEICFLTLSAAVSYVFLPPTTCAIFGTANSNKSPPTRFAAGTIYLHKNGIAVLPLNGASAQEPRPRCRPMLL